MYKAIIFDFFDVIRTDAYKTWLNLHEYKLEGIFLDAAQKQDHGEISIDEFLQILGTVSGQSPTAIFEEMESNVAFDHDVLALVQQLRMNYKVGLLSNAPSPFLRDLLQEHDLEGYFDEIVISSEVSLAKPHPEIFHHALRKMNVRPEETIFIDDSQKNIDGAGAVGIHGILFTNADKLRKDLQERRVSTSINIVR